MGFVHYIGVLKNDIDVNTLDAAIVTFANARDQNDGHLIAQHGFRHFQCVRVVSVMFVSLRELRLTSCASDLHRALSF